MEAIYLLKREIGRVHDYSCHEVTPFSNVDPLKENKRDGIQKISVFGERMNK
jgi:hypothetical protein